MFTRKASSRAVESAANRRAQVWFVEPPGPAPSQTARKPPSAIAATRGFLWSAVVYALRASSPVIGTPRASKRRAKTPDPSPSCPSLSHVTTKPPEASMSDARADLPVRRVRVDGDLARERVARGVVAPREDAFLIAVLIGALPRDDELASQGHRDARVHLVARRRRVHDELAAERSAGRVEPLARYSEARAVSGEAHPDDHEIAGGVHARGRSLLRAGGECVHRKLTTQSDSVFIEPLTEDAVRGPVLVALPDDDEVAVRAAGDGRQLLLSRGVSVDLEIGCLGNTQQGRTRARRRRAATRPRRRCPTRRQCSRRPPSPPKDATGHLSCTC